MIPNLNNFPKKTIETISKTDSIEVNTEESENFRLNSIFQDMIYYMQKTYALPPLPKDATYKDFLEKTPCFHFAANRLDVKILNSLILLGGNINQLDRNHNNPLISACKLLENNSSTHASVRNFVIKLLKKNCDPHLPNLEGVCALDLFAKYNVITNQKIKNYVKNLPNEMISLASGLLHNTSDPELIDFLIAKGVDIETRNYDGRTALYYTLENGNISLVEQLLCNKANFNISLPIQKMIQYRLKKNDADFFSAQDLLDRDIDKLKPSEIFSAKEFFFPAETEKDICIELLKLLIKYGWDINQQDPDGNTFLLSLSVNFFNKEYSVSNTLFVKKLIDLGANLILQNHVGECAIENLAKFGFFYDFQIQSFLDYIPERLFHLIARIRSSELLNFYDRTSKNISGADSFEVDSNGNNLLMATCIHIGNQGLSEMDEKRYQPKGSRNNISSAREFIEKLILRDANYFHKNHDGETGIELFIKNKVYNNITMLCFLKDFEPSKFPIIANVIHSTSSLDIIELFVVNGISVDLHDSNGFTLLHKTLINLEKSRSPEERISVIAHLVKMGADPRVKTLSIGDNINDSPISSLELLDKLNTSINPKELRIVRKILYASRKVRRD